MGAFEEGCSTPRANGRDLSVTSQLFPKFVRLPIFSEERRLEHHLKIVGPARVDKASADLTERELRFMGVVGTFNPMAPVRRGLDKPRSPRVLNSDCYRLFC